MALFYQFMQHRQSCVDWQVKDYATTLAFFSRVTIAWEQYHSINKHVYLQEHIAVINQRVAILTKNRQCLASLGWWHKEYPSLKKTVDQETQQLQDLLNQLRLTLISYLEELREQCSVEDPDNFLQDYQLFNSLLPRGPLKDFYQGYLLHIYHQRDLWFGTTEYDFYAQAQFYFTRLFNRQYAPEYHQERDFFRGLVLELGLHKRYRIAQQMIPSDATALSYYQRLQACGYAPALYRLGPLLQETAHGQPEASFMSGFSRIAQAAAQGYVLAQGDLGVLYWRYLAAELQVIVQPNEVNEETHRYLQQFFTDEVTQQQALHYLYDAAIYHDHHAAVRSLVKLCDCAEYSPQQINVSLGAASAHVIRVYHQVLRQRSSNKLSAMLQTNSWQFSGRQSPHSEMRSTVEPRTGKVRPLFPLKDELHSSDGMEVIDLHGLHPPQSLSVDPLTCHESQRLELLNSLYAFIQQGMMRRRLSAIVNPAPSVQPHSP